MRCTFASLAVAALAAATFGAAAPLEKRGGYYNDQGQWVDDGYWEWSHGPKTVAFTPWANGGNNPQPTAYSSGNSDSGSGYYGTGTFFYQNGNAGACGHVNSDSAYIVALQTNMYSGGSHCGQTVYIKNLYNGQSIQATVADECPSCGSSTDLDLSTGAFGGLGGQQSQGVMSLEWHF